MVHRLVAEYFCPNPDKKEYVKHLDKNTMNNKANNLKWVDGYEANENKICKPKKGKYVYQLTLDLDIIKIWNSMTEISKDLNLIRCRLRYAIRKDKEYSGYRWRFCENHDDYSKYEWRDVTIDGYETIEVSNVGLIRNPSGTYTWGNESYGYLRVSLKPIDKNEPYKNYFVHALVALAFLGPPPEGMIVNHKDGHPDNNKVENLEYTTNKGNSQHAADTGLLNIVNKKKVYKMNKHGDKIETYESCRAAGRENNTSKTTIMRLIKSGRKKFGGYWRYSRKK